MKKILFSISIFIFNSGPAGAILIHPQDNPTLDSRPDSSIRCGSINLEQCVLHKQRTMASGKEDDSTLA
jgi:hypothetical protein